MKIFDFVGKRRAWYSFSTLMILVSLGSLMFNWLVRGTPLNFGVEFTGGSVMVLRFEKPIGTDVPLNGIRSLLKTYNLQDSTLQQVGTNDLSMRSGEISTDLRGKILADFEKKYQKVEVLEVDTIGPVIGKELRTQALWGLFWATLLIMAYVAVRFEFSYAVAGILALYHDAIVATGLIALFWMEVDVSFVAAILTIMGYSINDTIVIFDRVRENVHKLDPRKNTYAQIVNLSLNETMPRSINTVLTVLFMNLMLILFGGATIKTFALTLFVGFSTGAYSSIFFAAPFVVSMKSNK